MQNNHYIKYLSLIFFTGAVILSLELIASKILTPFFGVSLYIWTAILSVTLIFLAIGYQFGGYQQLREQQRLRCHDLERNGVEVRMFSRKVSVRDSLGLDIAEMNGLVVEKLHIWLQLLLGSK